MQIIPTTRIDTNDPVANRSGALEDERSDMMETIEDFLELLDRLEMLQRQDPSMSLQQAAMLMLSGKGAGGAGGAGAGGGSQTTIGGPEGGEP
jgi:hypothetical protein